MIDVSPDAHTLMQILSSLQRIKARLDPLENVSHLSAVGLRKMTYILPRSNSAKRVAGYKRSSVWAC